MLKYMLSRITSFLFVVLIGFNGWTQVTVDNSNTVEYYVQNVLLGTGVSVSNIQFNGGSANVVNAQVGQFTDPNSDVGLPGGLIMGSGNVDMAAQGNTGPGSALGGSGTTGSDTDLASITPNQIWDECVIKFDFVPSGDTIAFNYTFASEEYPEYVCGSVNDAFGFFLTGPKPGGGMYNAENVALVPDPANPGQFTTTPVSINTVNPGTPGGSNSPANCNAIDANWASYNVFYTANSTNNYEYDGRTTTLRVAAPVICGQSYEIKMAIGDGGDAAYDSGVFLEEGSFSSAGWFVSSHPTGYIHGEQCGDAYFVVSRSDTSSADTIQFELTGSATQTDDYTINGNGLASDTTLQFSAGQAGDTVWINTIRDGIVEPDESIVLRLVGVKGCVNDSILVRSIEPMEGSLGVDSVNICPPETAMLTCEVTGGLPPYAYVWSGTPVDNDTVIVSPTQTTSYVLSVYDQCGTSLTLAKSDVWVQCRVNAPNVFTPNRDGDNDLFVVDHLDDYTDPKLTIYNRWGKVVFEKAGYANDWDGTHYKTGNALEEGVYYYVVEPNSLKYSDYTNSDKEEVKRTISGFVQIMR